MSQITSPHAARKTAGLVGHFAANRKRRARAVALFLEQVNKAAPSRPVLAVLAAMIRRIHRTAGVIPRRTPPHLRRTLGYRPLDPVTVLKLKMLIAGTADPALRAAAEAIVEGEEALAEAMRSPPEPVPLASLGAVVDIRDRDARWRIAA